MPLYELGSDAMSEISETTFELARVRERADLQRLLRDQIDVLVPDSMVLAEEFSNWEDSNRRIDLLVLDRDANLVVVELKRTSDGGHMELQALRYAAMVSNDVPASCRRTRAVPDEGRKPGRRPGESVIPLPEAEEYLPSPCAREGLAGARVRKKSGPEPEVPLRARALLVPRSACAAASQERVAVERQLGGSDVARDPVSLRHLSSAEADWIEWALAKADQFEMRALAGL